MLFHLLDELGLCKVARRFSPSFCHSCRNDIDDVANLVLRHLKIAVSLPRHYFKEAFFLKYLTLQFEFLVTYKELGAESFISSIFRDASQKVSSNVFVDLELSIPKLATTSRLHWSNGWMVASVHAFSRFIESFLHQS